MHLYTGSRAKQTPPSTPSRTASRPRTTTPPRTPSHSTRPSSPPRTPSHPSSNPSTPSRSSRASPSYPPVPTSPPPHHATHHLHPSSAIPTSSSSLSSRGISPSRGSNRSPSPLAFPPRPVSPTPASPPVREMSPLMARSLSPSRISESSQSRRISNITVSAPKKTGVPKKQSASRTHQQKFSASLPISSTLPSRTPSSRPSRPLSSTQTSSLPPKNGKSTAHRKGERKYASANQYLQDMREAEAFHSSDDEINEWIQQNLDSSFDDQDVGGNNNNNGYQNGVSPSFNYNQPQIPPSNIPNNFNASNNFNNSYNTANNFNNSATFRSVHPVNNFNGYGNANNFNHSFGNMNLSNNFVNPNTFNNSGNFNNSNTLRYLPPRTQENSLITFVTSDGGEYIVPAHIARYSRIVAATLASSMSTATSHKFEFGVASDVMGAVLHFLENPFSHILNTHRSPHPLSPLTTPLTHPFSHVGPSKALVAGDAMEIPLVMVYCTALLANGHTAELLKCPIADWYTLQDTIDALLPPTTTHTPSHTTTIPSSETGMDFLWHVRFATDFGATDIPYREAVGSWKRVYAESRVQSFCLAGLDQLDELELVQWKRFMGPLVQSLDLSSSSVHDGVVSLVLRVCGNLRRLDLHKSQITDESLLTVAEAAREGHELSWLNLQHTRVSREGLQSFAICCPTTSIVI